MTTLLAYSLGVLLVLLLCRELTTWYFKIDRGLKILEEIRDGLSR